MTKKLILHFCSSSPITKSYIEFVNSEFNPDEHYFVIFETSFNSYTYSDNAYYINGTNSKFAYLVLIRKLLQSKKIIFHGFFKSLHLYRIFRIFPFYINKICWIIWGADLFYNIENFQNKYISRIIKKIQNIGVLTYEEAEIYISNFKTLPNIYNVTYINPLTKEILDKFESFTEGATVNILIGNSATESNLHREAIDSLIKFKDENIKIFVPLSYGDSEYAKSIVKYGLEKFSNKFIPLLEFLPPENYAKLLGKIDIALFNNRAQQSLGNIFALLYLNKKIFIRKDNPTWNFLSNKNYSINDIMQIPNLDFHDFTQADLKKIGNKKIAENTFYNVAFIKSQWCDVFMNAKK